MVARTQKTIFHKTIEFDRVHSLPDEDLRYVIQTAQNLGLQVMLKPHVNVLDGCSPEEKFRGNIGRDFSACDWKTWFAAYQHMMHLYAKLAWDTGVVQFCVGVELSEAAKQEAHWRETIQRIRSVYQPQHGRLTYAANFGTEANGIKWWNEPGLDFIGVDAYYEMTDRDNPTVTDLEAAWTRTGGGIDQMTAISKAAGKQVLITELGWMASNGANQRPYDDFCGELDQEEQRACYQATVNVFESLKPEWLAGVFWYTWGSDPYDGGPSDDGYSPYDKPAEDVIRTWCKVLPRPHRTTPSPPWPEVPHEHVVYRNGNFGAGWCAEVWHSSDGEELDLKFPDPNDDSKSVIKASSLQAWVAVSFVRSKSLLPQHFQWLTFRIRGPKDQPSIHLWIKLIEHLDGSDPSQLELRPRPIDDVRYIAGGTIGSGEWKEVRIPLSHLNGVGRTLDAVYLQDRCGGGVSKVWIDDVRFVW
ncbi:MAG: hypothetical protein KDA52_13755 [Planctomycetaceae bacterium]|nr:hypothetical protein [Planctomycetaceae bacterium]